MIFWWRKVCFCEFMSFAINFAVWSKKCQGKKHCREGTFSLRWGPFERFKFGLKKLTQNSIRQLCRPIDILSKPVSDINQIINCFFAVSMRNAYPVVSSKTKNSLSITTADQCYGCNKLFIERKSLERHECLWAFSGNHL